MERIFLSSMCPHTAQRRGCPASSPPVAVQSVQLQKPDFTDGPKERNPKFFHCPPIPSFQGAYVVFQKPGGVSATLVLKSPLLVSEESHPVKNSIHKWIHSSTDSVPDPEALRAIVDPIMETFDKRIAGEDAKAKEEEGVPVEEGWVEGDPSRLAACAAMARGGPLAGAGEVETEARETKMEHLAQLHRKFEKDKQRIELIRRRASSNRAEQSWSQDPVDRGSERWWCLAGEDVKAWNTHLGLPRVPRSEHTQCGEGQGPPLGLVLQQCGGAELARLARVRARPQGASSPGPVASFSWFLCSQSAPGLPSPAECLLYCQFPSVEEPPAEREEPQKQ